MKKFLHWADDYLEESLGLGLLMIMSVIICCQIFFRYMSIQVPWTEEIARYMFVWMIYLGVCVAIKRRKHLKIDAVQLLFSPKVNFVLDIISNIVFLIFCIFLITNGTEMVYKIAFVQHQKSPAAGIPMVIPHLSWYICCFVMIFRLIQDTFARIRERKAVVAAEAAGKGAV